MRLDRDVQRLLATHGYDLRLRRTNSGGTYNTTTGKVSGGETLEEDVRGVFINYMEREVDGTSILADDSKLLLQARGLTVVPETGDTLDNGYWFLSSGIWNSDKQWVDAVSWDAGAIGTLHNDVKIISVRTINDGGTVIAYVCQMRG